VKLRELMRKINDSMRPVHRGNDQPTSDSLDARATANAGSFGSGATAGGHVAGRTDRVPSQQDEHPDD
jgi:hypothetical protein